ncbi:DUF4870 domain-containing protein [Oceanobacillus sp. 143]|uniref:DUF4870 domain-containing protein n=1 Tax=Oceanobacillus zhaokaii TaxID=2052660 RepID=A0A345PM23_9BACI|nr:hypothetical protein CUC15_00115 [Oceanobacillus zhaokaii]QGS67748.1 DUF4870 domain-containing protein [Oceanobacillus sp. 143]
MMLRYIKHFRNFLNTCKFTISFHSRKNQDSYAIYGIIAWILVFVLIGFVLLPILGIMAFIFTILAAIKSYNGEYYRIPLSIRFFG